MIKKISKIVAGIIVWGLLLSAFTFSILSYKKVQAIDKKYDSRTEMLRTVVNNHRKCIDCHNKIDFMLLKKYQELEKKLMNLRKGF